MPAMSLTLFFQYLCVLIGRQFPLLLLSGVGCLLGNHALGHEINSHEIAPGVSHVHELSIAVSCAEPPFYGFDGFEGREWDLVRKALLDAGHKARLYYLDADEGLQALEKGMIDGIWTCCSIPAPQQGSYFSTPLLPRKFVAISLASSNLQINSLEDIAEKKVALHPSLNMALGPEIKQIMSLNPLVQTIPNHELLILLMFAGRIDVLITESDVFEYHLKKVSPNVDKKQPIVFHEIFDVQYPRLVFRDPVLRDEFDNAWRNIQTSQGAASKNTAEVQSSGLVTEQHDAINRH